MRRVLILVIVGMMFSLIPASAQRFSISTDLLGYACLGTLNADVSMSVSQKWSITAGVRYNPFTFSADDPQKQFQLRQKSFSFGTRMWPWHNGSGWWFCGKVRYQEYNMGGIFSRETREGDRFGAGLYTGYTYMISRHFNIEFGMGLWGGLDAYRKYSCPACGVTLESGKGLFLLPDDIMVSLAYVF
jgi:hypothetical protein